MSTRRFTACVVGLAVLASGAAFAGGTISGSATFSGTPPKLQKLNRKSDPVCAKKEMNDETILLGKDGKALENV
ncbi:MAG TPA: hypothetical protein VKE49_02595, partial [Myxococcaceae bacterium]|nr:hypothetical protein [Myxococcaceae bacterium]